MPEATCDNGSDLSVIAADRKVVRDTRRFSRHFNGRMKRLRDRCTHSPPASGAYIVAGEGYRL